MSEKKKPFFSIIIPTFNVEKVLDNAINSIKVQSSQDYEIIIVDGGSTDNTLQLIESYRDDTVVLRSISEKDRGIYDAMNKGVKMSQGHFLYFLGADDYLLDKNVLSDIKEHALLHPVDVIYGNVNSPKLGNHYAGKFTDAAIFHKNISHQAIFFKRNVFDLVGFYNLSYHVHADWVHNMEWFFHKTIKHRFIDRDIAYFSDGGYSAVKKDHTFRKHIFKLYYKNARNRNSVLRTLLLITKGVYSRISR
ncbi:glycosyltransferase family 2 protein [Nonlabens sp. Asnod2-A12]|uniref:glycosyltransferase family 2 protein n=1 Tax=Nonlabens sp. Asnod2-A12 TaxID=3160578 RepID=UPI0038632FBB